MTGHGAVSQSGTSKHKYRYEADFICQKLFLRCLDIDFNFLKKISYFCLSVRAKVHFRKLALKASLKEAFFLGSEMNFFDKIGWALQ